MIVQRTFLLLALLITPLAFSADVSGTWKHSTEPGWLEIQLEEGGGSVVRNDMFPEREGRKILKDLQAHKSKQGVWKGMLYVEKLAEYKKATVTLPEPDRMLIKVRVGFISRTMEWVRVDKLPEAE
jgi:hypothetical protein